MPIDSKGERPAKWSLNLVNATPFEDLFHFFHSSTRAELQIPRSLKYSAVVLWLHFIGSILCFPFTDGARPRGWPESTHWSDFNFNKTVSWFLFSFPSISLYSSGSINSLLSNFSRRLVRQEDGLPSRSEQGQGARLKLRRADRPRGTLPFPLPPPRPSLFLRSDKHAQDKVCTYTELRRIQRRGDRARKTHASDLCTPSARSPRFIPLWTTVQRAAAIHPCFWVSMETMVICRVRVNPVRRGFFFLFGCSERRALMTLHDSRWSGDSYFHLAS